MGGGHDGRQFADRKSSHLRNSMLHFEALMQLFAASMLRFEALMVLFRTIDGAFCSIHGALSHHQRCV